MFVGDVERLTTFYKPGRKMFFCLMNINLYTITLHSFQTTRKSWYTYTEQQSRYTNSQGFTNTLSLTFFYVTVSTLNPAVQMVVTNWPRLSLYKIASRGGAGQGIVHFSIHTEINTHQEQTRLAEHTKHIYPVPIGYHTGFLLLGVRDVCLIASFSFIWCM